MKVKISDILEFSKIIDSIDGDIDLTVSDMFEIRKFQKNMKDVYSYLDEIGNMTSNEQFNFVCNETIFFDTPNISVSDLVDKYGLKLTQRQKDTLHHFLPK